MVVIFFGFFGTLVDRSCRMFRWSVEHIDLEGFITNVDYIVPLAGRNKDGPVIRYFSVEIELIFTGSHHHTSFSFFNADELISSRMNFETNFSFWWDRHHRHLQFLSRPLRSAEIRIARGQFFDIDNPWLFAHVMPFALVIVIASTNDGRERYD